MRLLQRTIQQTILIAFVALTTQLAMAQAHPTLTGRTLEGQPFKLVAQCSGRVPAEVWD